MKADIIVMEDMEIDVVVDNCKECVFDYQPLGCMFNTKYNTRKCRICHGIILRLAKWDDTLPIHPAPLKKTNVQQCCHWRIQNYDCKHPDGPAYCGKYDYTEIPHNCPEPLFPNKKKEKG